MSSFKEYLNLLNECASAAIKVKNKLVLVKNRDRAYYPTLGIVREMINGIEVAYMYDYDTDYSEGMNELGIAIVNTTLQGKKDEKALDKNKKVELVDKDGFKIRKALGCKNVDDIIKTLDVEDNGVGGHNTIVTKDQIITIEKVKGDLAKIEKYSTNDVIVKTNHGEIYPQQGYQHGQDRDSSLSRQYLLNKYVRNAVDANDVLVKMRTQHEDIPGFLEPYRTNYKIWTSSQIMCNITDLELTLVVGDDTIFKGVDNRLPTNYTPKIKLKVQKIVTNLQVKDLDQSGEHSMYLQKKD